MPLVRRTMGTDLADQLPELNTDDMKKQKNKPEKVDKKFPGYPPYPANEDIMNRGDQVPLDGDGIPDISQEIESGESAADNNGKRVGNEELETVNNLNPLEEADEELKERIYPVDFTGGDLDIPGTELDDASEETGNEDEENNSYSLGNLDQ